jgi:hypothetical protein
MFADLAGHFSVREIVDVVSVIAFFGFLNRWNDTVATTLEQQPLHYGRERLAARGWEAGKHGGGD